MELTFFVNCPFLCPFFLLWDWCGVLRQENHVEGSEEHPKKTKRFLGLASDTFDAEFYARINDDIYVNVGE
jgi:hypothetical protein